MRYEVPIVYRGLVNFVVEAESPQRAEEIARDRWASGGSGDDLGNEWEDIEYVKTPTPLEE